MTRDDVSAGLSNGLHPARPASDEAELVSQMTSLATQILSTFGPDHRRRAHWVPVESAEVEAERVRWFYTPTDHGGVPLRELAPQQQSLVMQLVSTALTRPAYVTLCVVMGMENVLDELEGWHVDWGRERGRDPGLYWLRLFGKPGDSTWGWRFGGHHVSVNILVLEGRIVGVTPCFFGVDPARSPLLGGELRPLGGAEDLARNLIGSLAPAERGQAVVHPRAISDIVSGNRPQVAPGDEMMHMQDLFRGPLPEPRLSALVDRIDQVAEAGSGYTAADHSELALGARPGLSGADLRGDQRDLLRQLVAVYTDRSPAHIAEAHRQLWSDDAVLDQLHIAWAGGLAPDDPHYYRLTGPRLLVEYDNTQRGVNHAHSVWRDPVGDFGLDLLAHHRSGSHHHH